MPKPAKIDLTDAEMDTALARAKRYEKYARTVIKTAYSRVNDTLRLVLSDGAVYTLPRHLIQGLADALPEDLNRIQIVGGGTGLLWPTLDVAHYVPGLLQGVYGTEKWMETIHRQRQKLRLVAKSRSSGRSRAKAERENNDSNQPR